MRAIESEKARDGNAGKTALISLCSIETREVSTCRFCKHGTVNDLQTHNGNNGKLVRMNVDEGDLRREDISHSC